MSVHHGTIRKYTAALLDLFNALEVEYNTADGVVTKPIPVKYSSREKVNILSDYDLSQLRSGNTNVIPRANLALAAMNKLDQRVMNKNSKISKIRTDDIFEFMYNSVPYEFIFEFVVQCRGMNEAMMIVEQVAPLFNPVVNIDIWDVSNLDEPTRVPVKLLDVGVENEDYEEFSSNIVTVNFGLSLTGNLYPPIRDIPRIKEFKKYLNTYVTEDTAKTVTLMEWDVDANGVPYNPQTTNVDVNSTSINITESFPGSTDAVEGEFVQFKIQVVNAPVGSTVTFTLADGTAIQDLDYSSNFEYSSDNGLTWAAVTGPVAVAEGTSDYLVRVETLDDIDVEFQENFRLLAELSTPDGSLHSTEDATINDNYDPYTAYSADLALKIDIAEKGVPGGVATLDDFGRVPASQLPSSIDEIEEYTDFATFPVSGVKDILYLDLATGDVYRWSGTQYVSISSSITSEQANRLTTPRQISLNGVVLGGIAFDGSQDVVIQTSFANLPENTSTDIVAGEGVAPYRAVYVENGQIFLADKDIAGEGGKVIGITGASALQNDLVEIFTSGAVSNPSWDWVPGKAYLGNNGVIVQPQPASGEIVQVGIAIDNRTILIDVDLLTAVAAPTALDGGTF